MCWKTEAGVVQSVGTTRLQLPSKSPKFLQYFRYVIFKEEEDMLGLIYHAVCIDFVLDSRGKTPAEACKGLKNSVESFICATLRHATDKSKAYSALKEQKENRSETRELVYRVYKEVLAHNDTIIYRRLRPHYKRLYDSVQLGPIVVSFDNYTNFYSHAYSAEDIESLYNPKKLPSGKIKKIVVSNNLLLNNIVTPTLNSPKKQHNISKRKQTEMV